MPFSLPHSAFSFSHLTFSLSPFGSQSFPIRQSVFLIWHSVFLIWHSVFLIWHSVFFIWLRWYTAVYSADTLFCLKTNFLLKHKRTLISLKAEWHYDSIVPRGELIVLILLKLFLKFYIQAIWNHTYLGTSALLFRDWYLKNSSL